MDDHDLDIDAQVAEPVRLLLDAVGFGQEQQPLGVARSDELGSALERGTDDTDLDSLDLEDSGRLHPIGSLTGGFLDDVRGQEREVGPCLVLEQSIDTEVELTLAANYCA